MGYFDGVKSELFQHTAPFHPTEWRFILPNELDKLSINETLKRSIHDGSQSQR